MSHLSIVLGLALVINPLLWLLARLLPREGWQILAVFPGRKFASGAGVSWQGSSLTFYGFFLAWAGLAGVALFLLLLLSLSVSLAIALLLVSGTMLCAVTAARVVAGLVERKRNTFTVAGAATVALYFVPLLVWLLNRFDAQLALMPVLAALSTAYVVGEGLGRLACISFGCCYGRPLAELSPGVRHFFRSFACRYEGETKKIAYASHLAGEAVVPIQAMSAFFLVNTGLGGIYLFLQGYFAMAFVLTAFLAMGWRVFSERLRADYRGGGRLTVYQRMGIANIFFCLGLFLLLPDPSGVSVRLPEALAGLWAPAPILFLQGLWLVLFLYFGLSRVIGSRLEFHVRQERI